MQNLAQPLTGCIGVSEWNVINNNMIRICMSSHNNWHSLTGRVCVNKAYFILR